MYITLKSLLDKAHALGNDSGGPGFRRTTVTEGKVYALDFTAKQSSTVQDISRGYDVLENRKVAGLRGY